MQSRMIRLQRTQISGELVQAQVSPDGNSSINAVADCREQDGYPIPDFNEGEDSFKDVLRPLEAAGDSARSRFDRYNTIDTEDLHDAARQMGSYLQGISKTITR
jgi:hypothetical protein